MKNAYTISLTQVEWNDLLETLRQHDKALAETIIEQIDQQVAKGLN